jgi:hypothetical protein
MNKILVFTLSNQHLHNLFKTATLWILYRL